MYRKMHEKLLNLYRMYLCVGGMPEAVENFILDGMNILQINKKIIEDIINSYINDMNKHVNNKYEAAKNESIYRSIPVQIGNKSNKFQYTKIEKNARKRDYESSMEWLLASNMIYKCCKLNSINIPPEAYKYNPVYSIRISSKNFGFANNIKSVPLYAAFLIK